MHATLDERSGNVKFSLVRSDGKRESLLLMVPRMKDVFVKKLPNVPRPHACRLVFDRERESFVPLQRTANSNYVVMNECCYRPFLDQKFDEIEVLSIFKVSVCANMGRDL